MKKLFLCKSLCLGLLLMSATACKKNETKSNLEKTTADSKNELTTLAVTGLAFQSRFDDAAPGFTNPNDPIKIVDDDPNNSPQVGDIRGQTIGLNNSSWLYHMETFATYGFSNIRVNYEGGTSTDRIAQLATYPVGSTNRCLQFVLKNATIPEGNSFKGRVATDLFSKSMDPYNSSPTLSSDIKQYKQRIKFYIPWSWTNLRSHTFLPGDFLLLFEFGIFQAVTGSTSNADKSPFRIRFDVRTTGTASTNRKIILSMTGEDLLSTGWNRIWTANPLSGTDLDLEPGNWYEAEIYLKEGGNSTGRAALTMRKIGYDEVANVWQYPVAFTNVYDTNTRTKVTVTTNEVFRVVGKKNGTPIADNVTTGFTNFAPMKLYAHKWTVDDVFTDSSPLQIWYDDLTIHTNVTSEFFQ